MLFLRLFCVIAYFYALQTPHVYAEEPKTAEPALPKIKVMEMDDDEEEAEVPAKKAPAKTASKAPNKPASKEAQARNKKAAAVEKKKKKERELAEAKRPKTDTRSPHKPAPLKNTNGEITDAAIASAPSGAAQLVAKSSVVEIVATKSYIDFAELDPVPEIIEWDKNSGKYLYISNKENPFIFFFGKIKEGHEISIDNSWVPTKGGRFEVKVSLPLEPSTLSLKIFSPQRKFHLYRLIYSWSKFPPSLRFKVKEEEAVIEKAWGFSGRYSRSGYVQLYSNTTPMPIVDLDSEPQSNLYFRILYPPEPEDFYDSWVLTVRDGENRVVGEYRRLGAPPPFLEWREIRPEIYVPGTYSYSIDLYGGGGMVFEGKPNRFDVFEGNGLQNYHYVAPLQIEPREEIGFFSFNNDNGTHYQGVYLGADAPLIFKNKYVLRATAMVSLHNLGDTNLFNFTRVGAGFRFSGTGHSKYMGNPYFYRMDLTLNYTNFTLHPSAVITRYTQFTVMAEPHFVLWTYHYLSPWVEFGSRLNFQEMRLSFGVNYFIHVRPWNTKFGIGFASDNIIMHPSPLLKFSIFRSMVHALFIF